MRVTLRVRESPEVAKTVPNVDPSRRQKGTWRKSMRMRFGPCRTGLLADDGRLEGLADFTRGEMEGFTPAVLVEVGDEGVELVHELGGGQDALPDALAALLIEKLVVRVDAGVDETLGHRASLAAERVEGVLAKPRDFRGDVRGSGDAHAHCRPLHRGVLQLGDDVADDGGRRHLERTDV